MANYTITPEQKAQFEGPGYVAFPDAVPPELLTRLRAMADRLEAQALEDHAQNLNTGKAAVFDTATGPVLERVDKLLEWSPDEVLDLLATPAMLAIAREFCGQDAVPIEMDMLYKRQHPNGYVIWHQGAQNSRRWPYLNIGVYLDDAPIDDGCLRYVPGTQHEKADICALSGEYGWDLPGSVDQPTRAGDILVQDMMVLHSSLPKRREGVRRTIYIEVRTSAAIVGDESQSEAWAELRRRWMALVVARAEPADWPEDWRAALPEVGSVEDEVAAIAALHEPPLPAHYCHHPVDHPNYPVPADLRETA